MNPRIRVVLFWLVPALVALPPAAALERRVVPASVVDGSESALVEQTLDGSFGSPFSRTAVLVLPAVDNAATDVGRARVRSIVARVESLPFVTAVTSPATSLDTLLVGANGSGAVAIVGIDASVSGAAAIDALRDATAAVGTEALWTGRVALETDLRRTGAAETRRSELRAVPVSLLLAVWAFGGVAAGIVGVAAGVLSILTALAITALVSFVHPVTVIAPGIASLLGLAIGIDYALLVMLRGRSPMATTRIAVLRGSVDITSSTGTIRIAALAAAAGFVPLLFVPVSELRSAGIAALAAIVSASFVASFCVARLSSVRAASPVSSPRADASPRPYLPVRRPILALLLSLPPLLLLAAGATRMNIGTHDVRSLPRSMESARALERLAEMGRGEAALGLRAIVTLPAGMKVFDDAGWAGLARVESELRDDPRVADVRSIRTVSGGIPPADVRAVFPAAGLRSFTSRDEASALIEIIPERGLGAADIAALVTGLRERHSVVGMRIGGVPAHSVDYANAIVAHAGRAVLLAVTGAFIILFIAFRSVLVAAKAVLLNLLSASAAVGATVLVFQEGIGASLMGAAPPLDGIFATVPLLAFCAVFAIGMDYEVFLLARIVAGRRSGLSDEDAIAHGVASSARLITRAAAIMITVFIAFALGDFIVVRMIGFALAVAVAIDATIVRLVLAPALMCIAGRWNWWPGERRSATAGIGVRQRVVSTAP